MTSCGGGTIALAAQGTSNSVLQAPASSAEAYTPFRRSFKKYTHFSLETLACDGFSPQSGTSTRVEIPRVGDILNGIYIQITLPGIANVISPLTASENAPEIGQFYEVVHSGTMKKTIETLGGNAILDPTPVDSIFEYACTARWAPALAMIKSAQLIVGNAKVDELTMPVLSIWKELTDSCAWKENWGDYDTVEESIIMSKQMQIYYIDLPFAFFLKNGDDKGGNSLSLITLSFHGVAVNIEPYPLSSCVVGYADGTATTPVKDSVILAEGDVDTDAMVVHKVKTVVRDGQSVSSASKTNGLHKGHLSLFNKDTASVHTLSFSDIHFQLLAFFAYLADDERTLYSEASFETVITCWDTMQIEYSSNNMGTIEIALPFSHPTAALFVVAQSRHNLIASNTEGAVSEYTQYRNDHFDWGGITEPITGSPLPIVLAASLELNSSRLNTGGPSTIGPNILHESYHRKLTAMQSIIHPPMHGKHASALSGRKYIYIFPFSLDIFSDPNQPKGFANLARIDVSKVKLQLDDQIFADNSLYGGEDLRRNRVNVTVLAFTYNIFRYVLGLGGKAFN
jgi:hypothetical protein